MKFLCIHKDLAQLIFLGVSNCYLVRERDGFTLVDCTISGQATKIIEAARELGGSIRRILLTHAHVDHIGSLDQLHAQLGTVDVAISQREAPFLHKDLSLRPNEPQQKPKGGFPGAKTRPTHTLTEGELFGSLRCIATPGHTPGHFSFLDERDGTLFAGDALMSIGGLHRVTAPPWYFPFPRLATWDFALADASARRLLDYKPTAIATGHGRFITNGTEELGRALG
jgi:glyoxylase-like metal-dependent hydrolase (beta-lactamase superfamily II)